MFEKRTIDKIKSKSFFKELISITLGVLIALIVNNWKENYQNKQHIKGSLDIIEKELASNINEIEVAINNNNKFIDSLKKYVDDENVTILSILKSSKITSAEIKTSSFKLLDKNIELVKYDIFVNLSQIDESKELRKIKVERIFDHVYQNGLKSDKDAKTILMLGLYDLISSDNNILESHKNVYREIQ